jgi:hypothetical protein
VARGSHTSAPFTDSARGKTRRKQDIKDTPGKCRKKAMFLPSDSPGHPYLHMEKIPLRTKPSIKALMTEVDKPVLMTSFVPMEPGWPNLHFN